MTEMDHQLFDHLYDQMPKFNSDVTRGLATVHLRHAPDALASVIRCAAPKFPEGLVFLNWRRCTPEEELTQMSPIRKGRRQVELARSDIYLCCFMFKHNGEEIPIYMYMPFSKSAGNMMLMGSTFLMSPVLSGNAISVGQDEIFVQVNRGKMTFKRIYHMFRVNDCGVSVYLVWGNIHNALSAKPVPGSARKLVTAKTTCGHYLFCKYGVTETFKRFAKADVVVGYPDQINETNYPSDRWMICTSTQVKPRSLRSKVWSPSHLAVAVPKDQYNHTTEMLMGVLFYVADHFPDRVIPRDVDQVNLWRILLGHIILPAGDSEAKIFTNINNHMESIDAYIDPMAQMDLAADDIHVDDIYQLFVLIIQSYSERLIDAAGSLASMYDKKLNVLRYVMYELRTAVFMMMFGLQKLAAKKPILQAADVKKVLETHLKPRLIMRINRGHPEVSSYSCSGDNMFVKGTSRILQQADASNRGSKSKGMVPDDRMVLDASIANVGSYLQQPKGDPTGRGVINAYVRTDPDGKVLRSPHLQPLLDQVQKHIKP